MRRPFRVLEACCALALFACAPRPVLTTEEGPPLMADPFAWLPPPSLPAAPVSDAGTPPADATQIALQPPPTLAELPRVTPPPLAVVRMRPLGEADAPNVLVVFNQPAPQASLELTPRPPGEERWLDPSTLLFEPAGGRLPRSTHFTARVGSLASWSFSTPRFKLQTWTPFEGAGDVKPDEVFELTFDAKMDARGARQIRLEPHVPLRVLRSERDNVVRLQPAEPLKLAAQYALVLPADLRCAEGPDPLGAERRIQFATYGPLQVVSLRCGWGGTVCPPDAPIAVQLSTLVPPEAARFVHAPAAHKIVASGNTIELWGPFAEDSEVEVHVDAGLRDVHGQTLQHAFAGRVRVGQREPSLTAEGDGVVALRAPSLKLEAHHVARARVRVTPLDDAHLVQAALDAMHQGPPQKLDAPEVAIGAQLAVPHGFSRVQIEKYVERVVQVTSLGLTAAFDDQRVVALVTRLADGAAVRAQVRLVDANGALLAQASGDGLVELPGPVKLGRAGPFALIAESGGEKCFVLLEGQSDAGSPVSSYAYRLPEPRPPAGGLWTERGAYRPGDTVHLFAATRPATALKYVVRDPSGAQLAQGTLAATPLAAASLQIPASAKLGGYTIEAPPFWGRFEVREFRVPEIRATVTLSDGLVGDTVQAHVRAEALFGAPLAGGSVRWTLEAQEAWEPHPPGWVFGSDAPRPMGLRPIFRNVVANGETKLDAHGAAQLEVKLAPCGAHACSYTLEAEVEDEARRSVAARASVTAHAAAVEVGVRFGEGVVEAIALGEQAPIEVRVLHDDAELARGAPPLKVELTKSGEYVAIATGRDNAGRESRSEAHRFVGGVERAPGAAGAEELEVKLDRAEYSPGDVAHVSVPARGTGLLVVAHQGLRVVQRFDGSADVPVDASWIPDAQVTVALISGDHYAAGSAALRVSRAPHTQQVALDAPREAQPGQEVEIAVSAKGKVILAVVDEGALSVTGYETPDVLAALWPDVQPEAGVVDLRGLLVRKRAFESMAMPARAAMAPAPAAEAPSVRSFFASTAYFGLHDAPARVRVKLPDQATEFRIFAIASDGESAGSAQQPLKTKLPLFIRPALPRFLSAGDSFEAGGVVTNLTGAPAETWVLARAANVRVEQGLRRVHLNSGESREVRFAMHSDAPGAARIQLAVTNGALRDAVELTLPVREPRATQAFAAYGSTESAVKLPLHGGALQLALASTQLQGLREAADAVLRYPYSCAEQTASRIVAGVVMHEDVADAVAKLQSLQRPDGGFGMWPESVESHPFVSSWATIALTLAKAETSRARAYLQQKRGTPAERAQAQLALSMSGAAQRDELDALVATKLPMFARAELLEALVRMRDPRAAELTRELRDASLETAQGAHLAEAESDALRALFHSADRTDAVGLAALLIAGDRSDLVEKLTRGLLAARHAGAWSTTQANAWALLALQRYGEAFESKPAAFDAAAWVDQKPVAAGRFDGAHTLSAQASGSELVVAKRGEGRLWYSAVERAPAPMQAAERGFLVTREYDSPVKAGDTVRIRLRVVVPDRRMYVAIVDPLPAGLEAVDPALKTSATHFELGFWNHRELRDSESRWFADELPAGVYELVTYARALTPGRFTAPPAHAEEMYAPETYGRSAPDVVEIK